MSLTVAVQMDPIEKIRIAGDSTFALLLEAQARGHRLLYYTPDRLSMRDGQVVAPGAAARGARRRGRPLRLGDRRAPRSLAASTSC